MPEVDVEQVAISPAATASDYAAFAVLINQYTDWCRARYADDTWFVDAAFGHQSLETELEALPVKYGPPEGLTLLARQHGVVIACGAYRRIGPEICEMKRVYVPAGHQGKGLGRRLCLELMARARSAGYTLMRLDTANRLTEAIALYKSLGFAPCVPYHSYPASLMPYLLFMERALGDNQ